MTGHDETNGQESIGEGFYGSKRYYRGSQVTFIGAIKCGHAIAIKTFVLNLILMKIN
ncbi:MAG: hypothetical protein O4861_22505 [Trichodesmium sp. St16_bin4-tuft]|nr:hypothetical protein [Trichodesmium sp. St16_bin4-tuft]